MGTTARERVTAPAAAGAVEPRLLTSAGFEMALYIETLPMASNISAQLGQVEAWAIRAATAPSMVCSDASTVTVRS